MAGLALLSSVILRGLLSARPTDNTASTAGRLFFATDTLLTYRDNGSTWDSYSSVGVGNVVGPASAVSGHLAVFSGPSGQLLADGGPNRDYILVRDEKTIGTAGGTFTTGAWKKRDIAEISDVGNHCSVANSQIILQAGTYECEISAPAIGVSVHQARLQNITDGITTEYGTSSYSDASPCPHTTSVIRGRFTIAAQKTFEIQHQCASTKATFGFGAAASFGTEVYTVAEFWKVA